MTHLSLDIISPPEFQTCILNYLPDFSTLISNRYVTYNMPKMGILTFPYPPPPQICSSHRFPHLSEWCHHSPALQVPSRALILESFLPLLLHRQIHQSPHLTAVHANATKMWGENVPEGREGWRHYLLIMVKDRLWESDIKVKIFLKQKGTSSHRIWEESARAEGRASVQVMRSGTWHVLGGQQVLSAWADGRVTAIDGGQTMKDLVIQGRPDAYV